MVDIKRVESVDYGFLECVKWGAMARLPSQYLGAGKRINTHPALPLTA